jgi:hypothetical protein
MFLGTLDKVYILDKVENNEAQIDGHPAWASGTKNLNSTYSQFTVDAAHARIRVSRKHSASDERRN